MAAPPDAPQWDLLPHDPIGFFELEEGFGRKDLKRAYNRLLRVYKPEKFPQEFQKIRSAYEELDEQLRYHGGATKRQRSAVPQDWQTDAEPATNRESAAGSGQTVGQPAPKTKRLVDRVADESPAKLFAELKERADKSPYEYYALALLSDLVE
ncbi:J domain-containing protein [Aeoliella mucimassa]|uniref:J domain-containing protein n=1 Tax=Aeoliella mucimassa TaxID=2527972 RepID=A0A518ATH1_9BACT|nr:J domain-containing protein [Aeoliella mucimassa]QDU58033.1 hypothetical protein Pan181_42590 [Aeoliella mucimassa]